MRHPFFTEFFNPNKAMTANKDLNILKKLINYKIGKSKFHETIYAFICNNYISIDEEKQLRAVFRYMDKEEKNSISKEDLKSCLNEINIYLSNEEFNNIFKLLDANQSDYIEYQEFLRAACDKKSLLTEENLKNTFLALSGGEEKESINREDIKKFIFHDSNIQDNILNEYLEQFGMKLDEKMNFEQFSDIIKNNKNLNNELNKEEKKEENNTNINNEIKNDNNKVKKKKVVEIKGISIIEENEEYNSNEI